MARLGRVALALLIGLLSTAGVGAAQVDQAARSVYPRPYGPGDDLPQVAGRPHDPAKPTAVIVFSQPGTNIADTLPEYEVLASTEAFNLYTVAPERRPVTLTGGLELVPDLSFADLEARRISPDAIIVPQLIEAGPADRTPVVTWLREQADDEALVVSVCVGTWPLGRAGLLDGRAATSHWLGLIGLRRDFAAIDWREGVRYVEDGNLITSAGVLSGIDATLRVIERLVGPAAARSAAEAVDWPLHHPGGPARFEPPRLAPADSVALLSAAFRADRPRMGVLLHPGVGETEVAAALRPYTELSYLSRPLVVTADGQPIRTRHGLTLFPRGGLDQVRDSLDRLVVPGADAARSRPVGAGPGPAPVYLHERPGFAFDGPLRDIAANYDTATATWVAKSLQYPLPADVAGPAWPWLLSLRALLLVVAGAAITLAVLMVNRSR